MAGTVAVAGKPRGTSWISVIGGWIASVGMAALLAPLAAGVVGARGGAPDDISLAVPAVLAVLVAYIVGGYVAGRMSGYATSWHGLMTAFFGLFVILAVILVGVAADRGYLGDVRIVALDGTNAWSFPVVGDALTFAAILGFLAAIFGGWLGGLLAPTRRYAAATRLDPVAPVPTLEPVHTVEETTVVQRARPRRPSFKLFPSSPGRHDAERVVERKVDQTER